MDNKYWLNNCPAKMSDGRFITDYTNAKVMNQEIKRINGIKSVHEYRHFLQKNRDKIAKNQEQYLQDNFSCKKNETVNAQTTNTPLK